MANPLAPAPGNGAARNASARAWRWCRARVRCATRRCAVSACWCRTDVGAVDSQVGLVRGRDCGTGRDGLVPRRVGQRPSGADREGAGSCRCQHDDRQQAAGGAASVSHHGALHARARRPRARRRWSRSRRSTCAWPVRSRFEPQRPVRPAAPRGAVPRPRRAPPPAVLPAPLGRERSGAGRRRPALERGLAGGHGGQVALQRLAGGVVDGGGPAGVRLGDSRGGGDRGLLRRLHGRDGRPLLHRARQPSRPGWRRCGGIFSLWSPFPGSRGGGRDPTVGRRRGVHNAFNRRLVMRGVSVEPTGRSRPSRGRVSTLSVRPRMAGESVPRQAPAPRKVPSAPAIRGQLAATSAG